VFYGFSFLPFMVNKGFMYIKDSVKNIALLKQYNK